MAAQMSDIAPGDFARAYPAPPTAPAAGVKVHPGIASLGLSADPEAFQAGRGFTTAPTGPVPPGHPDRYPVAIGSRGVYVYFDVQSADGSKNTCTWTLHDGTTEQRSATFTYANGPQKVDLRTVLPTLDDALDAAAGKPFMVRLHFVGNLSSRATVPDRWIYIDPVRMVQFYLMRGGPDEKHVRTPGESSFQPGASFADRSRDVLGRMGDLLQEVVGLAAGSPRYVLPVVLGYEDFFQGGELCTADEMERKEGQCLDRDYTFEQYFAGSLTALSVAYPSVLIVPGSAYVSVVGESRDKNTYAQNGENVRLPVNDPGKRFLYVQNVAPVFFGGHWIRLVKKGSYIMSRGATRAPVQTSQALFGVQSANFDITDYREDELTDINSYLVFFGKTPLPGEEPALPRPDDKTFFDPFFETKGVTFGLEICGDHQDQRLQKALGEGRVDVQMISSHGTIPQNCCYDAVCVQADTVHYRLCLGNAILTDYEILAEDKLKDSAVRPFPVPIPVAELDHLLVTGLVPMVPGAKSARLLGTFG